jgi:hypothetical protein
MTITTTNFWKFLLFNLGDHLFAFTFGFMNKLTLRFEDLFSYCDENFISSLSLHLKRGIYVFVSLLSQYTNIKQLTY